MEPERHEYKGHSIELRQREGREVSARAAEGEEELELLIDDESVRYGQLPDGQYALEEYAYDWTDDLLDLAQRYIDYRERAEEIRREADSGEEG
ncbi:MAG: twin-arginine translocation pathway signal protein [Rubrobacteraceae bacterium]|nr:twin-arginine translocation pathway signal protein [Rubrobacteraceae bacterium]